MTTTDPQEELRLLFRRIIPINARNRYARRDADDMAASREIVAAVGQLRGLVTPQDYARIYAEEKTRHTYGAGQ